MTSGAGSGGSGGAGTAGGATPSVTVSPSGNVPTTVITPPAGESRMRRSRLPPLQRAGMQLALAVGILIAVVTVAIVYDWITHIPTQPVLSTDASTPASTATAAITDTTTLTARDQAAVEQYRRLMEINSTRATTLFDTIIGRALLPVFTAILGYIFGTRAASSDESETGTGGGS